MSQNDAVRLKLNEKQALYLQQCMYGFPVGFTSVAVLIGGRGGGKTVTIETLLIIMMNALPRAKGQFACTTVSSAKRAITPGIKAGWIERFGMKEYNFKTKEGDFVLWRKPPDDWDIPYKAPDDWSNCISFPNGFVVEFCGYFLNADMHRGRSDDFAVMDEGLRFKEEWLKVLLPCIRANPSKYNSPLHWLFAVFSSPPYAGDPGAWMYQYEKLAKTEPNKYFFDFIRTRDNQAFLPPDYIDNLRNSLTKLQFKVEVEGERITRPPQMYYPTFMRDKHCPDADQPGYYYKPFAPLEWSLDFNAHFTSGSVWQSDDDNESKCVGQLFVREPDDRCTPSQTLAKRFVERYAGHPDKRVALTGDRNGASKNSSQVFVDGRFINPFEEIAIELQAAGWNVQVCPIISNSVGYERFLVMQEVFQEKTPGQLVLRLDPVNAASVIVSIENSPILANYSKNKASETDGSDQELATHFSDTVDYYVIFKKNGGVNWVNGIAFDISFM